MTRQQLIDRLAMERGITKRKAKRIVETVFDYIGGAMAEGDRIEIRGFGSFKVKHYDTFIGRNPKTGEAVKVKPKTLPVFKVGKALKERVNE